MLYLHPLLSVRHVLHDQVPLCTAARMECRLPAPDAARQGGEVPEGRVLKVGVGNGIELVFQDIS